MGGMNEYFSKVVPPRIDWAAAATAIRTGTSTSDIMTLPSWAENSTCSLPGGYLNQDRVTRLSQVRPAGLDPLGRGWHVGVLYPVDYLYENDDDRWEESTYTGVVTFTGHVGILPSPLDEVRNFVDRLKNLRRWFVIPVIPLLEDRTRPADILAPLEPYAATLAAMLYADARDKQRLYPRRTS